MPRRGDEAGQQCGQGPRSVTVYDWRGQARVQPSHPEKEEQANPYRGRFCVALSYPLWSQCVSCYGSHRRQIQDSIHNGRLRLWGETATSESSFGSRSELSMAMWVSKPGFWAFHPMADQWIKGKVTACALGLRFGQSIDS